LKPLDWGVSLSTSPIPLSKWRGGAERKGEVKRVGLGVYPEPVEGIPYA